MADWLIVILAGCTLAFVTTKVSVYIGLRYLRKGSDDFLAVNVFLPGNITLYSMKVPVIELTARKGLTWLEAEITANHGENETHSRREQRFVKNSFWIYLTQPRRLRKLLNSMRYYTRLYRRFMHKVIASICCERLYWKTTYGSEDAAITAIMTGVLWSIKAMIITFLKRRCNVTTKPVIEVIPVFDQAKVEVDFQCIFSIKLGNVIYASKSIYHSKAKEVARNG